MKFLKLCYWLGHDFDHEKFINDLDNFCNFTKNKEFFDKFKNIIEYKNYLENPPNPYCKRCKMKINNNGY